MYSYLLQQQIHMPYMALGGISSDANGTSYNKADEYEKLHGETQQPPPSFTESQAHADAYHLNPEKPLGNSSAYPIQPHHTPTPARVVLARYTNWAGSHIGVFDGDESRPLFRVDLKMTKPQMRFNSGNSNTVMATVNFHNLSSRIDATINGDTITLTSPGFKEMLALYGFPSAAEPGLTLTWRAKKWSSQLNCEDQSGMPIARFSYGGIRKKNNRMEILAPRAASGRLFDEVVVTGITMAHMLVFITMTAATVAAS